MSLFHYAGIAISYKFFASYKGETRIYMIIKLIYYVGSKPTDIEIHNYDISREEASLWIETDYKKRLEKALDKTMVNKRTINEIVDEYNKEEKNNWQKMHRHCSFDLENDDGQLFLDNISDPNEYSPEDYAINENLKNIINNNLSFKYFDVINCILFNKMTYKKYAQLRNIKEEYARQIYHRAIIALKKIKDKLI